MQNLNDSKEQSLNGHGVDQEETPFVSNKNEKPVKNGTGNKVADKNYSNLGSDSNVKKEEEEEKPKRKVSFGDLFKFAKKKDKIIMAFAFLCSFAQGAAIPAFAIIFGDFTNDLSGAGTDITELTIIMVLIGVAVFIVSLAGVLLWSLTSSEQVKRLKLVYYEKLLYQNSSWYDKQKIDALAVEYTNQVTSFQSIFSTKLHILFVQVGMVISGLLIGFIVGWSFALFVLLLSPLIILGMVIFAYFLKKNAVVQSEGYKEAGSVTDQAFTYIKTIKSLNGEEHEIERYSKAVDKAKDASISFGFKGSLGYGFMMFFALLMYAFAFLIGSRLVANDWQNHNKGRVYNVGDIISIFFCVIHSAFSLAIIGPMMKEIEEGKRAIASILDMVEENLVEDYGNELVNNSKCVIEFKNVSFAYPTNPEHIVLKNLDFTINSGEKIAIVGPSGSGKSTVIQLLMRYYNPTEGEILLNGINIREYNIKDLRNSIGLVSQQPILFADTIKYNLLLGLNKKESISDEYLLEILKQANAHDFVVNLEKKLDEYVGSMGGQLSGGQKQRIAIARALIRKPALFLFDEATSALDRTNEREIQETIDRVSTNNTSVTVAHRLSTVINSDVIYVLDKGELIEKGSHKELVKIKNGVYKELIENQVDGEEGQDIELEESLHGDDLRLTEWRRNGR